jgi:hypothetical protein
MASYLNLCTACELDFASVSAFDRHRVGSHAYDFPEGLDFDPPREDGRRCLDEQEMSESGMEKNARGRWSLPTTSQDEARFARLRNPLRSCLEASAFRR